MVTTAPRVHSKAASWRRREGSKNWVRSQAMTLGRYRLLMRHHEQRRVRNCWLTSRWNLPRHPRRCLTTAARSTPKTVRGCIAASPNVLLESLKKLISSSWLSSSLAFYSPLIDLIFRRSERRSALSVQCIVSARSLVKKKVIMIARNSSVYDHGALLIVIDRGSSPPTKPLDGILKARYALVEVRKLILVGPLHPVFTVLFGWSSGTRTLIFSNAARRTRIISTGWPTDCAEFP
jgi:hypothetical protein